MKRMLVPTDFSEASKIAFPVAKEFAALSGESEIHLVSVVEEGVSAAVQCEFGVSFLDPVHLAQEVASEAEQELKKIQETVFNHQAVQTHVIRGVQPIASEIALYARQNSIDLIILATHGRSGLRHLLLGSVAEHLVREAPCPVLVVPEQSQRRG